MVTALSRSLQIAEEIRPKECALRSNIKSNNVNLLQTISLIDIGSFINNSCDVVKSSKNFKRSILSVAYLAANFFRLSHSKFFLFSSQFAPL